MKKKLSLLLIILSFGFSFGQNQEPEALVLQTIKNIPSKPKEALQNLFKSNPTSYTNNKENLDKFSDNLVKAIEVSGEYGSYEKLEEKAHSKKMVQYKYLMYYKQRPILLDITMYNFAGKWMFYNLSFYADFGLPKDDRPINDKPKDDKPKE
ncbi:MAG TPA: hypothetical protein DCM02_05505 [Flavobacterium sp.]|nr:hypothetical protein [Flavobacterium sp.]